jgi:predicted kinase
VREFLEGAPPGRAAAPDQRLASFAPGFEDAAYEVFFADADAVLDSGRTVVLDGGFPTAERRARARALADRHGVPFRFVECHVAPDVARRRLARRDAEAGLEGPAWQAVYDDYARRWEAPREIPDGERVFVDTERPLAESVEAVTERLPLWPQEPGA